MFFLFCFNICSVLLSLFLLSLPLCFSCFVLFYFVDSIADDSFFSTLKLFDIGPPSLGLRLRGAAVATTAALPHAGAASPRGQGGAGGGGWCRGWHGIRWSCGRCAAWIKPRRTHALRLCVGGTIRQVSSIDRLDPVRSQC